MTREADVGRTVTCRSLERSSKDQFDARVKFAQSKHTFILSIIDLLFNQDI